MKANRKGRSATGGRFVALAHFLLNSAAWRSLTPGERALYVELCALYNGSNNGRLALGARRAAELCNVSKNTVPGYFDTLSERGFVECVTPATFGTNGRRAPEWRLTMHRCDVTGHLPTKAFARWSAGSAESRTTYRFRDKPAPVEGHEQAKSAFAAPVEGQNPQRRAG